MPLIPAACSPCADAPVVQLYALQGFSRPAYLVDLASPANALRKAPFPDPRETRRTSICVVEGPRMKSRPQNLRWQAFSSAAKSSLSSRVSHKLSRASQLIRATLDRGSCRLPHASS